MGVKPYRKYKLAMGKVKQDLLRYLFFSEDTMDINRIPSRILVPALFLMEKDW